jgi:hypothetical protein
VNRLKNPTEFSSVHPEDKDFHPEVSDFGFNPEISVFIPEVSGQKSMHWHIWPTEDSDDSETMKCLEVSVEK